MPRLPFDEPADDAPSARAAAGTSRTPPPMSVGQLALQIKSALTDAFPGKVRVVGEVSNFSGGRGSPTSSGGHWFFSLKDAQATIRCVCFASVAQRVAFSVANGLEVVATGRVDMYPAQGSVQFYIDKLEPVGQGALELALRQLIEELRQAGYFDASRKRRLPMIPRRVAVVTSRGGAALQDVINTSNKRWPGCRLLLYDVRVQGDEAAPQIAAALRGLSRHGRRLGIDAIILTRGGGSIEDLWAFNERIVADAVFDCSIPVVAAIGHETDTTIAELVADQRCATPTQAAMSVVPDHKALKHQLAQMGQRMALLVHRQAQHAKLRIDSSARHPLFSRPMWLLERSTQRLDAVSRHALFARPGRLVDDARGRLDAIEARLRGLPAATLGRAVGRLDQVARHLEAVGPRQVLARGYTYTLDAQGKPITVASAVSPGDRLTTVFHDGQVVSTAQGATPEDSTAAPTHARTRQRRISRKSKRPEDDAGLFDLNP